MRLIVLALLLALATGLTARWALGGLQRPLGISLVLILCAFLGWQEYRWYSNEKTFSAITADLSSRPEARVRCQRLSAAMLDIGLYDGTVQFDEQGRPSNISNLSWKTCRALTQFAADPKGNLGLEHVQAVHVLAHEAMHVSGIANEAQTSCAAVQRTAETARALGLPTSAAQRLAARYWRDLYPNQRPEYLSPDCVESGPWDQTPKDKVWP